MDNPNLVSAINDAYENIKTTIKRSPLERNDRLSDLHGCDIFLKREDLNIVRSFKIRGALNKILKIKDPSDGVVCASAGNHAQGVAYACNRLNIFGDIFVPECTPKQKLNRISYFGKNYINIHTVGKNFDSCLEASVTFCKNNNKTFVHPFDDFDVIAGQGTIAKEILDYIEPDIIIATIGGGGLVAGVSAFCKEKNRNIQIFGVETETAPSMKESVEAGKIVNYPVTDTFVDGATVSRVGEKTFDIVRQNVDKFYCVPVGRICQEILDLYNFDGIAVEPAGCISTAILDKLDIRGKKVVCIISGGNNDIRRYPEIEDRYLRWLEIKQYYIITFVQKPNQLRKFINDVLGPDDDIIRFEYLKKTNKEYGNVLIGIEFKNINNVEPFETNMTNENFEYIKVKDNDMLFNFLV